MQKITNFASSTTLNDHFLLHQGWSLKRELTVTEIGREDIIYFLWYNVDGKSKVISNVDNMGLFLSSFMGGKSSSKLARSWPEKNGANRSPASGRRCLWCKWITSANHYLNLGIFRSSVLRKTAPFIFWRLEESLFSLRGI